MNLRSAKSLSQVPGTTKENVRRDEILSGAAKVIADAGYEKASIRRIAAEMGMSISALYYYFSSKEELLFSIQYESFQVLLEKLETKLAGEEDAERKLYLLVENHLEHFLGRLTELTICSHELNSLEGEALEEIRGLHRKYYNVARGIVREIMRDRKRSRVNATAASLHLFGMLNWIYKWFDPEKSRSVKGLADEIYDLFLNGIKSRSR